MDADRNGTQLFPPILTPPSGDGEPKTPSGDGEPKSVKRRTTPAKKKKTDKYVSLLQEWGISVSSKASQRWLTQARAAGWSPTKFRNIIAAKHPGWLKSIPGRQRIADVRGRLADIFGISPIEAAKDADFKNIIRAYVKNPNMTAEMFDQRLMERNKQFRSDYKYIADLRGTVAGGAQTLGELTYAYRDYQKAFRDIMANAGLDPSGEEEMFFKSGTPKEEFANRFSTYLQNRDVWKQLTGIEMTAQERQQALYGTEGQRLRDALTRAATVQDEIQKYQEDYAWAMGREMTQQEKKNLLFNEGNAQQVYKDLRNAFSARESYSNSKAGSIATDTNEEGNITLRI